MNRLPSIHNNFYNMNLLDIIDDLPDQSIEKQQSQNYMKTNISVSRNESICFTDLIQNHLINVTLAFRHECDGLGNDIEINDYQIMKAILGKGAHSFVKLAKKDGVTYVPRLRFRQLRLSPLKDSKKGIILKISTLLKWSIVKLIF